MTPHAWLAWCWLLQKSWMTAQRGEGLQLLQQDAARQAEVLPQPGTPHPELDHVCRMPQSVALPADVLLQLWEQQAFVDVQVCSDDGAVFECHRVVLAAASTYFR